MRWSMPARSSPKRRRCSSTCCVSLSGSTQRQRARLAGVAANHDLPDVAAIWRLLLAEAPELVAELALVATAAEELPALLRDGLRQSEPAPLPMAEHLVQASPVSAAAFEHIRETLTEIAAAWPAERPLRVLEI